MKKAAIFDLDGTLVISMGLHDRAWEEMFARYDIVLDATETKEHVGKKNVSFIASILERRGEKNLDPQTLSDEKDMMVIEILKRKPSTVYPGAKELLKLLHTNGMKNILATSATRQTAALLGKELMHYFDTEIFAEDVDAGKPNPEIFLKAAAKLGLHSNECIVFEDATSGVQAAKAGGFFCIARDNELGQNLSGADVVVKEYHPQELLEYFL